MKIVFGIYGKPLYMRKSGIRTGLPVIKRSQYATLAKGYFGAAAACPETLRKD